MIVVDPSDIEIYSVVQGDMKTTNRLSPKKKKKHGYQSMTPSRRHKTSKNWQNKRRPNQLWQTLTWTMWDHSQAEVLKITEANHEEEEANNKDKNKTIT